MLCRNPAGTGIGKFIQGLAGTLEQCPRASAGGKRDGGGLENGEMEGYGKVGADDTQSNRKNTRRSTRGENGKKR